VRVRWNTRMIHDVTACAYCRSYVKSMFALSSYWPGEVVVMVARPKTDDVSVERPSEAINVWLAKVME